MITRPEKSQNKILLVAVTIILLFGAGLLINKNLYKADEQTQSNNEAEPFSNMASQPELEQLQFEEQKPEQPLPATFSLSVPFTPQAPTANWDELHNEACEEASAIMAYAYYNDVTSLPASYVETKISELTKWQQDNYGYNLSITTEETSKMIENVFGLKTQIVDISEETIKRALVNDKLIILPANGKMLGNPYFKPPGPIYHMLVITGYNETGLITNDPGTRRGLNYSYTYETLYQSNGNWSHTKNVVDLDDKKIIIVSK